jgi:hypothetical protein
MQRLLWLSFWVTCLVVGIVVSVRLWSMRMLADTSIRASVQTALEVIAKREGWFISDIEMRSVHADRVIIHHRRHMRGVDPIACYKIPLSSLQLLPCDS